MTADRIMLSIVVQVDMPISMTYHAETGHTQHRQTPLPNNTIMADMHIMVDQLSLKLDNGEANVCRIVDSRATVRCVPHESCGN